jgi:methylated-DNA-[protein]-cysteine S-methyltransferase
MTIEPRAPAIPRQSFTVSRAPDGETREGSKMPKKKEQLREWVFCLMDTPLGPLWLFLTRRGLKALKFVGEGPVSLLEDESLPPRLMPFIETAQRELDAYFNGVPTDFADLTLALRGTPFQRRVWRQLRRIPYGSTISYGELARRVGNPQASRAVGQATGANPIPLIIPCHRVIAADGSLGGYRAGPDRKLWLLRHEGAM